MGSVLVRGLGATYVVLPGSRGPIGQKWPIGSVWPRGGAPEQLVTGDTLLGQSEHLLSHAALFEQPVATDGARRRQEETWQNVL